MGPLKVLVVVPSGGHWVADFATSLISLVAHFANKPVPGYSSQELQVMNIKGSILPKSRLQGLKAAKAARATHLLFLDSDHTFPPSLLSQLLACEKGVVAANCVTKSLPAATTARRFKLDEPQGIPVYSDADSVGLQKVWRVGTGVMLLSAWAFEKLPHDSFGMVYKEEADTYQGEDWTMCEALEKAGVSIYIEHSISRAVGHVGMLNYTHEYVGEVLKREAA